MTFSRFCVKAELTLNPYFSHKGKDYFSHLKSLKIQTRSVYLYIREKFLYFYNPEIFSNFPFMKFSLLEYLKTF